MLGKLFHEGIWAATAGMDVHASAALSELWPCAVGSVVEHRLQVVALLGILQHGLRPLLQTGSGVSAAEWNGGICSWGRVNYVIIAPQKRSSGVN